MYPCPSVLSTHTYRVPALQLLCQPATQARHPLRDLEQSHRRKIWHSDAKFPKATWLKGTYTTHHVHTAPQWRPLNILKLVITLYLEVKTTPILVRKIPSRETLQWKSDFSHWFRQRHNRSSLNLQDIGIPSVPTALLALRMIVIRVKELAYSIGWHIPLFLKLVRSKQCTHSSCLIILLCQTNQRQGSPSHPGWKTTSHIRNEPPPQTPNVETNVKEIWSDGLRMEDEKVRSDLQAVNRSECWYQKSLLKEVIQRRRKSDESQRRAA